MDRPTIPGIKVRSTRSFAPTRWRAGAALAAALLTACFNCAKSTAESATPVLVVAGSKAEAYAQAVEGIRAGLASAAPVEVIDISSRADADRLPGALSAERRRLAIAVGIEAVTAVTRIAGGPPVIATMILQADTDKAQADRLRRAVVGAVALDLSVASVCREWRRLAPGKTRLGIIRNPLKEGPPAAVLQAQASSAGCSARIVDCSRPEELLAALRSAGESGDLVWCIPDSALYTSATVKALLTASLERQIPLAGFSESFVRAGAALGVYPDFTDVGRQTAELARRWLAGEPAQAFQAPRVVRVAVNSRVARLIGLRYTVPPDDGRVLVLR